MQLDSLENAMLSAINPILKAIIERFDVDCNQDGDLLVNSLKRFHGEDIQLCRNCRNLSRRIADPFYEIGSRILRIDKDFMRSMFLGQKYREAWLKGFALMMKGIRKYGIHIPFTPAGPFQIVWNFTYLCNLKCKHCYEDAGVRQSEFTTDQAYETLDVLSRIAGVGLPSLSFSGGEPLLRKDFFEVTAYAKKRIPYISIATNGTLLTRDNVKQLKDVGVDYVEISLDGASKETHEGFRGVSGCFKKTMKGIENCVDAGLDTCIAAVAHRENQGEIPIIMELAEKLGIRFINFNYIPTGRAKEHMELDLAPEERMSILEMIGRKTVNLYTRAKQEEVETGRTNIRTDQFLSTCPQYASVVKNLSEQIGEDFKVSAHYGAKRGVENIASFLGGCGAGRLYIALEPNGDLKPCVFFPTNRETVLGNILEEGFDELWSNTRMLQELRNREHLESYKLGGRTIGCGNCRDKYICGGCRARSYGYFDGTLTSADIGCIKNEKLWKRMAKSAQ
ncbi:MAG: radical SAM protein [Candidatus Bathyarchaeota archaeon]|nr:MAG: radical SAM protein [Candidatus Bathyarchaeota archaeon]